MCKPPSDQDGVSAVSTTKAVVSVVGRFAVLAFIVALFVAYHVLGMEGLDSALHVIADELVKCFHLVLAALQARSLEATAVSFFVGFWTLHWLYYFSRFPATTRVPNGCKHPPTIRSAWIPFVGSGPELSKDSVAFTKKYHKMYGPVFHTKVAKNSTYFIKDFHFAAAMSRHPDTYSMHEFVKDQTLRIFDIEFTYERPEEVRKWAQKYVISGKSLHDLTNRYSSSVRKALQEKTQSMKDFQLINLFEFTNPLVFYSAIRAFFGNYDTSLERNKICEKTMFFDDFFVYIASGLVPEIFLKKQREAQDFVSNYLASALQEEALTELARGFGTTIRADRSRLMFMFAWALNANSLPTIFWMMLFLLRNQEVREQVMAEVYQVLKTETGWEASTATKFPVLSADTIKKMPLMRSIMWETLRRRSSVNLTRMVTKDTVVTVNGEKFFLPKGGIVNATNPHNDPTIFPEPEKVLADRFLEGTSHYDANGKKIKLPNMAFGHGVSLCPGRNFSLMEGPATVVLLLTCFDWEPVSPQAEEPPASHEKFGFGCMPLHPDYVKDPSIQFRMRVKPQFVKETTNE